MILLLLFLAATAGITYGFYLINDLIYLLPVWILCGLAISAILLLFIVYCIFVPIFKRVSITNRFKHAVVKQILVILCLFARTSYKVENKEKLIKESKDPLVVVSNHKSLLDAPWHYMMLKRPASVVAKSTLNKIPLFPPLVKAFQVIAIDRTNDRAAAKSIIEGAKYVEAGLPLLIYPEGGIKDTTTEQMVTLRAGAYKLATRAKATIQPLATHNNSHCRTRRTLFSWTKVTIKVLDPIPYEEYKDWTTTELGLEIAKRINATFPGEQVNVEVL